MQILDFHTHTFPDRIAAAAIDKLQAASHTRPFTDGTVSGLKNSMTEAGITASVVLPVATSARQVPHVNDASIALNDRGAETGIYSFGCMHPDYEDVRAELRAVFDDCRWMDFHGSVGGWFCFKGSSAADRRRARSTPQPAAR